MIRIILIFGLLAPLYGSGCAYLNVQGKGLQAGHQIANTQPSAKQGLIYRLTHPANFFHFLPRKKQSQQPKRAVALLTVGIIKTISSDGSYVIAELEPGIMVAAGTSVLITGNGGETAHLKVAEITPPYFVAEIERGHPDLGDLLKQ